MLDVAQPKDKVVVLMPKFQNNSDPIDQLRALALLKQENAKQESNELQLVKRVEFDNDDHQDFWRQNDDNFYQFSPKKYSIVSRPQSKYQNPTNNSNEFTFGSAAEKPYANGDYISRENLNSIERAKKSKIKAPAARAVVTQQTDQTIE